MKSSFFHHKSGQQFFVRNAIVFVLK